NYSIITFKQPCFFSLERQAFFGNRESPMDHTSYLGSEPSTRKKTSYRPEVNPTPANKIAPWIRSTAQQYHPVQMGIHALTNDKTLRAGMSPTCAVLTEFD